MTFSEFQALPDAQRNALVDLQEKSGIDWDVFLAQCLKPTILSPYVGVQNFHGMFVGVEVNGYTHS